MSHIVHYCTMYIHCTVPYCVHNIVPWEPFRYTVGAVGLVSSRISALMAKTNIFRKRYLQNLNHPLLASISRLLRHPSARQCYFEMMTIHICPVVFHSAIYNSVHTPNSSQYPNFKAMAKICQFYGVKGKSTNTCPAYPAL